MFQITLCSRKKDKEKRSSEIRMDIHFLDRWDGVWLFIWGGGGARLKEETEGNSHRFYEIYSYDTQRY